MTEQPTTTAGRRLLAQMHPDGRAEPDGSKVMALIGLAYDANLETIFAIEAEAREEGHQAGYLSRAEDERFSAEARQQDTSALREALEFVTSRGLDSSGCPGEARWGRGHKDVVHVAPYHCQQDDGCLICRALSLPLDSAA